MKVYFAGSIRGGRDDAHLYYQIIAILSEYGAVLTEHVGNPDLAVFGEDDLSDREIHDRDLKWLFESNVLIAEVSHPSLGVGYEIRCAIERSMPVLCLYRPSEGKKLSAMISGCPNLQVAKYQSIEEIMAIVKMFFTQYTTISK
jgi:hypothetical protein